jgi:hypothetical protein
VNAHDMLEHLSPAAGAASGLTTALVEVAEAGAQPKQAAFLAWVLRATARLSRELGPSALSRAAGARSDYAALLSALQEPATVAVLAEDDPLAAARLRGLATREYILSAEGGAMKVGDVAALLGLTRQGVDRRRRAGKLLALSTGRHGYVYPAWQFTDEGVLPGLEATLQALQVQSPSMRAAFFLSGNLRLGGTSPLAELRRGHREDAVLAAAAYGEHGAP